ncbi:MAG TPA: ATPase, T2SS/T4P/T4SS family [Patescibacteria group bacterium]|nr:ATPase, T2SS/T4P/T4SS family [Patescibacteria group bacterium]
MPKLEPLGDILIKAGLVDEEGLSRAREIQQRDGGSIGRALAGLGLTDETSVTHAIAEAMTLECPDLASLVLETSTAALLPAEFCRTRGVAPLGVEGRTIRLAMANPLDYATLQDVEFRTNLRVVAVVAGESAIESLVERTYPAAPEERSTLELMAKANPAGEVESAETDYESADIGKLALDTKLPPIVRLVNVVLSEAAKAGASDIHIEPQEDYVQVRHRIDGILHDVLKVPKNLQDSTISRIKVISGMDIAERRKPQDGRSRLRFEGHRIDLRVSTLPTQFGEKIVVRLLDSRSAQIDMTKLALSEANLHAFQTLLSRPQGLLLVTGPTGSGKTSTLYASLNWLKNSTKNILTVEDPIEYQLPGINQVQINSRGGVTFASGLRSILRQDPNIVLVGEIRDQETAAIAMEAAQTGHLLLSTIHTNDAPGSVTRLLDLGVEPFLVASSLIGILAQRLVRKPCPRCVVDRQPAEELVEKLGGSSRLPASTAWRAGAGCDECDQSGYRGRLAIHELLVINEETRDLISRRGSEQSLRDAARRTGMKTLMEDALEKAAGGLTTLEEVARVAPPDDGQASQMFQPTPTQAAQAAQIGESLAGLENGVKRLVLVVEDSPTVAAVVRYFLELEGFEVQVATNGHEGLEMARRQVPSVVVSDVRMPGMDGITMVKALRDDPLTRCVAILMLTSESSVETETLGLQMGADDFILKPVEPRRLAARVKALLARSQTGARAAATS